METIKYTINKADIISSLRNWVILNGAMLIANWKTITDMFYNWNFDCIEIRKMLVLSLSSLILFLGKRFLLGEKK